MFPYKPSILGSPHFRKPSPSIFARWLPPFWRFTQQHPHEFLRASHPSSHLLHPSTARKFRPKSLPTMFIFPKMGVPQNHGFQYRVKKNLDGWGQPGHWGNSQMFWGWSSREITLWWKGRNFSQPQTRKNTTLDLIFSIWESRIFIFAKWDSDQHHVLVQCEAPKIAFSWFITPMSLWFMVFITN